MGYFGSLNTVGPSVLLGLHISAGYTSEIELPGLTNKNTGYSVKFEFQMDKYFMEHILKFKFNWASIFYLATLTRIPW